MVERGAVHRTQHTAFLAPLCLTLPRDDLADGQTLGTGSGVHAQRRSGVAQGVQHEFAPQASGADGQVCVTGAEPDPTADHAVIDYVVPEQSQLNRENAIHQHTRGGRH